jgi:hypothetical protein
MHRPPALRLGIHIPDRHADPARAGLSAARARRAHHTLFDRPDWIRVETKKRRGRNLGIDVCEKVGYLLTFFFLSMFLMIIAGLKSWKQIALVAFFTALGVYIFFVLLLKQPLPTGFLGV